MTSSPRENPRSMAGLQWWRDNEDMGPGLPEELVQVSMLHVLKDHDEGIPIATHPIELDNVLML